MKKVLAIAVLVLLASTVAMASATNWMLYIQTDSLSGEDFGSKAQLGVKPASVDDYDSLDSIPIDFGTTMPTTKWAGFPITGEVAGVTNLYNRNYKSTNAYTTYPALEKKWAFNVGGLSSSAGPIRVQFQTGTSTATYPAPATAEWGYFVRLVDAKGRALVKPSWAVGAGTPWVAGEKLQLTVPVAKSTYFGSFELPELKVSPNSNDAFIAQGYAFEFLQAPIPEPASLLVLGTGLVGLAGFVSRKRRI